MNSRIAIATADGVSVSDHLARSSSFLILEIEGGRVAARAERLRDSGPCGNHKTFVELLEGCDAVICGGIGQGAFDSLRAGGIEPLVTSAKMTIEDAVARHLAGQLEITSERVCLCKH